MPPPIRLEPPAPAPAPAFGFLRASAPRPPADELADDAENAAHWAKTGPPRGWARGAQLDPLRDATNHLPKGLSAPGKQPRKSGALADIPRPYKDVLALREARARR